MTKKFWISFGKLIDKFSSAAANIANICLLSALLLVTIAVVMRYVFNAPFHFTEEISGYLVIAIVFLGLADTYRARRHIRVDLVLIRLPQKVRSVLETSGHLFSLVFVLLFIWYTYQTALTSYQVGRVSFGIWQVPLYVPQLLIPIGLLTLAIQIIAHIIKKFQTPRTKGSK